MTAASRKPTAAYRIEARTVTGRLQGSRELRRATGGGEKP